MKSFFSGSPDPAEGAYSAPANALVVGEGLAAPSPRTPSPAFGPSDLASPTPMLPVYGDRQRNLLIYDRYRLVIHAISN